MFRKMFFLAAILTLSFGFVSAEEPGKLELSLQDALGFAMQNNFDISLSRIEHQTAEYSLKSAKGIYDPSLSFTLNSNVDRQPTTSLLQAGSGLSTYMSRQDSYNFGLSQLAPWGQTFSLDWSNVRSRTNSSYSLYNPTYSSDVSLSTSLPLLKGFGFTSANRYLLKAKLDRLAADSTYSRLIRESLRDVESSYWSLVYAREQLEVTRKALEIAKEFQKETGARISVGTLAPIEKVSADAQVASREEEMISARSLVETSEDILKVFLGIRKESDEWNKNIVPTDAPNVAASTFDEEAAIQSALGKRDEIKELELALEKSKVDTKAAKNDMLPTLTLDGALRYNGSSGDYYMEHPVFFVDQDFHDAWDQVTDRDYKSWAVGLNFRIPIGNRTQRFIYQNYRLAQNAAEISLEKTRQNIISEVRSSLRIVRNTEKRIAAAEANLKLQKEKLDAEKKKYDNGLSTSFNVLSYQNDVLSAETSLLKAKIDHQLALSALERAEGTYLEARGIKFDVPRCCEEQEKKE
ncbi:MAG TPA: TolC family protein [Acidobacteriota bacterium]|nr:TolC family protein [Acidobacteriota bacterium]